jgi:hypothetical protein
MKIGKHDFFRLGTEGIKLSRKLGISPVTPPLNNQIIHDEWMTEMVLALEKRGYALDWLSESELKENGHFKDELLPSSSKISDAIIKMNIKGSLKNIAFEYERTLKSTWRIKEVLRAYGRALHFPLVIIICEDEVIKNSYLKTLKSLGDTNLNKRIGFTLIQGWHLEPEHQAIHMIDRVFCLKDIVNPQF